MADKTLELALRIVAEATGKQNIEQLVTELKNIEKSADAANPATQKLSEQIDDVAHRASSAEPATEQLNDALNDTTQTANNTAQTAGKLANELDNLGNRQQLIRSFEQSQQALQQQEISTAAAAHALNELQQQAKDSSKPFVELARGIDLAEKDLQQMRDELTQQTTKHQRLQAALKKSGVDTNNLRAAKRNLGAQFDKTGKSVDKFTRDLKQGSAAQKAQAASLSNVTSQVAALAAAYFGLDRVSQAVSSVFETGDKFEKLGIQMQALMGGIAQGEKATAWVNDFTKNTPLQLGEVSQAFVKLKAFGLDPMDGTLQSITDQALKLGGGFQEVEGISLALGQAWAKQKLQGEEILQLVERGIPVWELLEKTTGKNVQELQKLSSAGKLGRDVIKDLIDEMGRTSAGSAAAQMALFSGQVSNAKDNLEQFYNLIAKSGAMDWLKDQITTLNTEFAAMAADGRLQEWAQSISDAIVNTGTVIKNTASTLYEYREEIGFVAQAWLALKVGSYFSSVVSGALAATRAFTTYKTAITSATVATNAATVATNKWKGALGFIVRGGLYTALITELVNVGIEYNKLLTLENKVEQSQQKAQLSAAQLAEEYKLISESTGVLVTNMEQLDAALQAGTITFNDATGVYEGIVKKQQELAEATQQALLAEQQRQAFLTLTLPESLKVVESLNAQAKSLNGVRDGVDGFLQSLDAARTTLVAAGEQYSQQVALLDTLKLTFESHNESLARQAYLTNDVSKAYKELGLTSSHALTETATKLQGAFELIQQHNEPIALQQQAFLKWADAAIKAADATDQVVPASVQAAAASLGLSGELDKLIAKVNKLKPATDANSDTTKKFAAELNKTKVAIANNKAILESATASTEQKTKAQAALNKQTALVVAQETDLAKVRQLEKMNLNALIVEQRKLEQGIARINALYKSGVLTAEQYNEQQDRKSKVLNVVNKLLGDFKSSQQSATTATKESTQATLENVDATNKQVAATEMQLKSLKEQSYWYQKSGEASSKYSAGQQSIVRPTVKQIVDYQEKHETAYSVNTVEIQNERGERAMLSNRAHQYERFERDIKQASSNSALDKLYKQITQQLNYLTKEQRKTLSDVIKQQRKQLKQQVSFTKTTTSLSQAMHSPGIQQYYRTTTQDNSALVSAINKLIAQLSQQQSNKQNAQQGTAKTIKLQLTLPGGTTGDIYAQIRDELLNELEQLSNSE